MSEFTPGPWTVQDGKDYYEVTTVPKPAGLNPEYYPDAVCYTVVAFVDNNLVTKANARLIAAAPELLDALMNIECNLTGQDCFAERVADSLGRAKAAIAKAEGRANAA